MLEVYETKYVFISDTELIKDFPSTVTPDFRIYRPIKRTDGVTLQECLVSLVERSRLHLEYPWFPLVRGPTKVDRINRYQFLSLKR